MLLNITSDRHKAPHFDLASKSKLTQTKMECRKRPECWILIIFITLRSLSATDIVDELFDPERYDGNIRPGSDSGKPVTVNLDMFINSISSVDEAKMDYEITIFMRQRWIDDRLNFTGQDDITLNYKMFDRLWVPDLFVKNEKMGTFHQITVPNRLLILSPNGQVYYSQRLTLTLSCPMHLKYYPMDYQFCNVEFESYGYSTKHVIFEWSKDKTPVQISKTLEMPEFVLTDVTTHDCTEEYITGSFTCKYATFHLRRQFQYYLIQIFIPSCLIVSLSWVSFWIDIHAVPARVTLGLLTVLTMTTKSSSISSRLPRVSYIKAIDVWMTCCLVFVFGALIEFAIANVLLRKMELKKNKEKREKEDSAVDVNAVRVEEKTAREKQSASGSNVIKDLYGIEGSRERGCGGKCFTKSKNNPALQLDMVSRVLFPGMFIIFNIIYWIVYQVTVSLTPDS